MEMMRRREIQNGGREDEMNEVEDRWSGEINIMWVCRQIILTGMKHALERG